jgi:hypothetical protein
MFYSANVMRGHIAGVQTIMREMYMPKAVYVHCWTHRLHLVIVDVCRVVPFVDDFFSLVSKLYTYFTKSGVTNKYFRDAQEQLDLGKFDGMLFHFTLITEIGMGNARLSYFSSIPFSQIYRSVSL